MVFELSKTKKKKKRNRLERLIIISGEGGLLHKMWYGSKSGIVVRDWRLVELAKAFWMHLNTSTPPPPKDTKKNTWKFASFLLLLVNFGSVLDISFDLASLPFEVGLEYLSSFTYVLWKQTVMTLSWFQNLQYNWIDIWILSFYDHCLLFIFRVLPAHIWQNANRRGPRYIQTAQYKKETKGQYFFRI